MEPRYAQAASAGMETSFTKTNNFFLKIFLFCFVNSRIVSTFVHSSKSLELWNKTGLSLAVKRRMTLSA